MPSQEMTFDKIQDGHSFECVDSSFKQDNTSKYTRAIKGKRIVDFDFKSAYIRAVECKSPDKWNGHEGKCGSRSISVDLYSEAAIRIIEDKYRNIGRTNPAIKPSSYCIFRFDRDCGKIGKIKTKRPIPHSTHRDFFRCDEFRLEQIIDVEIKVL